MKWPLSVLISADDGDRSGAKVWKTPWPLATPQRAAENFWQRLIESQAQLKASLFRWKSVRRT